MRNDPLPKFKLEEDDRTSITWHKLMKYWEDRRIELWKKLETCSDEKQAATLRGQLLELRINLALHKEELPEVD